MECKQISVFLFFNILTLCLHDIFCFNLDAKFSTFYKSPSLQNIFFGYSVDYFANGKESWIVVGAPKSGFDGKVYKCSITNVANNIGLCEPVEIQTRESNQEGQMLGSTLSIANDTQLLTCAPKFTHFKSSSDVFHYAIGACYFKSNFLADSSQTFTYLPCLSRLGAQPDGQQFGFCQAGLSATFLKNNSKLLVGAVGAHYNQGSLLLFEGDLNTNINSLPKVTKEFTPVPPEGVDMKPLDYYRITYDNNYMGYTVGSGKTKDGKTFLVTSAPRRLGSDLVGAVDVYNEDLDQATIADFSGEQVGEYFGHGLAVADVNGDGLDDIIVGSPFYTDFKYKQPEIGRIYVYYQNSRQVGFSTPTQIAGNVSFARFGNTISSLGDVNGDGFEDILVSAPYEGSVDSNGTLNRVGALYVFNGGRDGLIPQPSQIIYGADLEKLNQSIDSIKGLGFSIKGGKDMDGNGYPDVVAGAYLSDQAIVIRARPVVRLIATITVTPQEIDLETQSCDLNSNVKAACFLVETCFSYSGKNLPSSVAFSYSYDVDATKKEDDKRTYLLDSSPRSETLEAGREECVTDTVYVKKEIKDKLGAIAVEVSYWLNERDVPVEPVLDVLTGLSTTHVADVYKHCGDDKICTPSLKVSADVSPSTVYVGQYSEVVVSTRVSNTEENAYQTLLVIQYPPHTSFVKVEEISGFLTFCTDVNQTVVCEVANPLKMNAEVPINAVFGVRNFNDNPEPPIEQLNFKVFANCSNEESFKSNEESLQVRLEIKTNIEIYNTSVPEIIFLDKISEAQKNSSDVISVSHSYEITNSGPSSISEALVVLLWPLRHPKGHLLLGLDDIVVRGEVTCDKALVVNDTQYLGLSLPAPSGATKNAKSSGHQDYYNCNGAKHTCSEIICTIKQLAPKHDVSITLKGYVPIQVLFSTLNDTVITSNLVLHVLDYPYYEEVSKNAEDLIISSEVSTFAMYPPETTVSPLDWWIIALAVGGGVLFLIIIIIILWRCGFFKRKTMPLEEDEEEREQLHQAELKEKSSEGLH